MRNVRPQEQRNSTRVMLATPHEAIIADGDICREAGRANDCDRQDHSERANRGNEHVHSLHDHPVTIAPRVSQEGRKKRRPFAPLALALQALTMHRACDSVRQ